MNRILYLISKLFKYLSLLLITFLFFISCSSSIRFGNATTYSEFNLPYETRILLYEQINDILIGNEAFLFIDKKRKALIKPGNKIYVTAIGHKIKISLGNMSFTGEEAHLQSSQVGYVSLNGNKYRGIIKILNINGIIKIVNHLSLEDYLKGVITKEMPLGKGKENFEALKAFAITARTYSYKKIFKENNYYDLLPDIRDQVYGGVDAATTLSDQAVDETKGMILTYDEKPCIVFYHSTCGGSTEDVRNVFSKEDIPYLKSIKDGTEPFCNISPNFIWKETFTKKEVVDRLKKSDLIDNTNYSLMNILIKSKFSSGRINELVIILQNNKDFKTISIFGNKIRYIFRNKSDTGILKSNNFNVDVKNDIVELTGKGYGHGVGLCQWGAIGQSRLKKTYTEILNHYFPGTEITQLYD